MPFLLKAAAAIGRRLKRYALSRMSVVGPLTFTDAMPLSLALVDEYISLVPMTSPLVAFSTK